MLREDEEGATGIESDGCTDGKEVLGRAIGVTEEEGCCEDVLGVLGSDWGVVGDCSETVWISLEEAVELNLLKDASFGLCRAGFWLLWVGVGGASRC